MIGRSGVICQVVPFQSIQTEPLPESTFMEDTPQLSPETLLPRFGLSSFRKGQKEVIETVLSGRDCLCVMPTGGGKSLCYQLPALAVNGVTLVVSPLIALMKDQVDQLQEHKIPVAFINSTLSAGEVYDRLDRMAQGEYRLVYVVPERFRSTRFVDAAKRADIGLLAVDEAHCISEWGHDFRPDYARLGQFRHILGNPPTIALTATATQEVREDIVDKLALESPEIFVRGFRRPNLYYRVEWPDNERDKTRRLAEFIKETPGSGIIYASSRKRVESVASSLSKELKRKVVAYHAGFQPEERKASQESFMSGKADIVVATNAFGMGIDKSDVRFVVHYNMPGTLEGYYQEAGRAGRDGLRSECLLYYHPSDWRILEYFVESSYPSREVVSDVLGLLRAIDADPIEMTQQEIKARLSLSVSAEAVGASESLLEAAGVVERLVASENLASIRFDKDAPSLLDLVPKNATRRRAVLQFLERLAGSRRGEQVFFRPQEAAESTGLAPSAVKAAFREINKIGCVTYVPPFRGRAIRVLDRDTPFRSLEIDFQKHEERKKAEYEKIRRVMRYVQTLGCRQRAIIDYFGDDDTADCGHCDNCERKGIRRETSDAVSAPPSKTKPIESGEGEGAVSPHREQLLFLARIALSGVARAQARCSCGKNLVAQMLRGSDAKGIRKLGFNKLSTYGLLEGFRQNDVVAILDGLITARYLKQEELEPRRPVIVLTSEGSELMRSGDPDEHFFLPMDQDLQARLARLAERLQRKMEKLSPVAKNVTKSDPVAKPSPVAKPDSVAKPSPVEKSDATDQLQETPSPRPSPPSNESSSPSPSPARGAISSERTPSTSPKEDVTPYAPESDAPRHYWTWRLLDAGFSIQECLAIRGAVEDDLWDDVTRAEDEEMPFPLEAVLEPSLLATLDELVEESTDARIRPLLEELPSGTRYEQVALYLRRKRKDV
jgi:ATP-dependent DNA helicase RecQ